MRYWVLQSIGGIGKLAKSGRVIFGFVNDNLTVKRRIDLENDIEALGQEILPSKVETVSYCR